MTWGGSSGSLKRVKGFNRARAEEPLRKIGDGKGIYRTGAEFAEKDGEILACGGAGMRQRRRPQDDDVHRIVSEAEK